MNERQEVILKHITLVISLFISTNTFAGLNSPNLMLFGGDNHEVFLGTMGSKYSGDSICNKYGEFGNKYSSSSIWAKYSTYGSKYNSFSPWNKYSSQVPVVVDTEGTYYGKFSLGAGSIFDAEERRVMKAIIEEEGLDGLRDALCD